MVYQGGLVVAEIEVLADGAVGNVRILRPMPALTEPVIAALRQWHFTPARLDGQPVAARTTVAVQVVLIRNVVG